MTCHPTNRIILTTLAYVMTVLCCRTVTSQEKDFNAYPENVANYLKRIYGQKQQSLAYRQDYAGGFDKWIQDARESLRQKIGLPKRGTPGDLSIAGVLPGIASMPI